MINFKGPSGVKMSSKIRESEKGKYAIEWVPVEVGSHLVEVYFYGKLVKGFPYVVKVFDPHRVKMLTKFETIGRYGEPMELCSKCLTSFASLCIYLCMATVAKWSKGWLKNHSAPHHLSQLRFESHLGYILV